MASGKIKRLTPDKGFGFLRGDEDGVERFFHRSAVLGDGFDALRDGDRVTFDPEETPKGPRATGVLAR